MNVVPLVITIIIYTLKIYVPVGWLFGLFVCPDFHTPTGKRIGTVHMSKEPSRPRNEPLRSYFRIWPHPGAKGSEGPRTP